MKTCVGAFSFIVAVTVLSGCASRPPRVIDQPIGPLDANASSAGNGTLVVYSGQESFVSLIADIQAGRKTVIDLNEEQFPPRARGDQWVRLPSGQIVGAKSR